VPEPRGDLTQAIGTDATAFLVDIPAILDGPASQHEHAALVGKNLRFL